MIDRLGDESSETDAAVVAVETQGNHVLKLNSGDFSLYHDSRFCSAHVFNSIQVYLFSAFHDTNRCKAALQRIKVSTIYLVVVYQW